MGTRGNFNIVIPVKSCGAVSMIARCQGRPQSHSRRALEHELTHYHAQDRDKAHTRTYGHERRETRKGRETQEKRRVTMTQKYRHGST